MIRAVYDRDGERFDALLKDWSGGPDQLAEALVAAVYQGPAWLAPLLRHGADVNAGSRQGDTALTRAATLRGPPDTVDHRGLSPFLHAALGADHEILKRLRAAGADPCRASPAGMTALMLTVSEWGACRKHETQFEATRWLCAQGVDVNARNR